MTKTLSLNFVRKYDKKGWKWSIVCVTMRRKLDHFKTGKSFFLRGLNLEKKEEAIYKRNLVFAFLLEFLLRNRLLMVALFVVNSSVCTGIHS